VRGALAVLVLILSDFRVRGAEPADTTTPESLEGAMPDAPTIWSQTLNGRASVGYNDNILLDAAKSEQSVAAGAGLEGTIIRLPLDGRQLVFYASGDYTHYFHSERVDHESFLLGLAQVKLDWAPRWQVGLDLEAVYLDQVIDTSVTENTLSASPVRGSGYTVRPSLRRELPGNYWVELFAGATRQFFNQPFDDYWEAGPKIAFGREYGFRSALALNYSWKQRPYDTRKEVSLSGADVPGTELEFQVQEVELAWRHNWDQQRRWRTATRLDFLANRDSGPGYFDYQRYQVVEQLRYGTKKWEMKAQVRIAYYHFSEQMAGDGDLDLRVKTLLGANLRAERRLSKYMNLFADYNYEQSLSNRGTDEYRINKVAAGVGFEF
jgi:hypothetical protein